MGPDFSRTAALLGGEGVAALALKRVAVFGVGGVGGHVCEALARAGIGALELFDGDCVDASNLNRQIAALCSTIGQNKAEVMARRIADINPACRAAAHPVYYTPQNSGLYPFSGLDYVVDAVDAVSAKVEIIARARGAGVPVISAMGAGNRLYPERFEIADIEQTSGCPLARAVRRELRRLGIGGVRVVYSREPPLRPAAERGEAAGRAVGSVSFVPGAAGMVLAGAVVRGLLGIG